MAYTAMNLSVLLGVVMVCCSFSLTDGTNPGFKARVTQSGLDYLRDVGLQILEKEVTQIKIPDINGNSGSPIGKIYYTLSNIRITNFAVPSSSLTTSDGLGLVLLANGLTLQITGNWHYSNHGFIHLSDSGSFTGSFSGATLGVTMRFGIDKTGRPTVNSASGDCSFDAGNVNIKLHGGASWLYNLFNGYINREVKSLLSSKTCSLITDEVNNDLQNRLNSLKTEAPINDKAVIDYSFLVPPQFYGHVDTFHKGEVFASRGAHVEAPFTVPVIPADPDVSRHIFLWLTDYLFLTAGYVYYQAGVMAVNVTKDMIPPGQSCTLDTSSWCVEASVPELSQKYPKMPLEADIRATAPPSVDISSNHLNASIKLDIAFFVILPNKSKVYVFTLSVTVHGSTLLSVSDNRLKWTSNLVKTDVQLKRSVIGKFDVNLVTEGIEVGCKFLLLPWLNGEGKKGLPLPTSDNLKLQKLVIKQGKGFVKLGADILFIP